MRRLFFCLLSAAVLACGCQRQDPTALAQQLVLLQLDSNTDSLRALVQQARDEGKKWKTDRWRSVFSRFAEAEAPIYPHLKTLRQAAETLPYRPEQIKAWLDQLAERRMEIDRIKNEMTEVARKTKNGKAAIGVPAATTTPTKETTRK